MQFADSQDLAHAYLILRSLYDGDVIEWPIADDHPLRAVFEALEQQGEIARWDRTWPRHDRYRLTERGIATIEAVYRPADADAIWNDLRGQNLAPTARRTWLQSRGYDPTVWGLLHDPSTHWDSYRNDRSRYVDWLWADSMNRRYRNQFDDDGDVPIVLPTPHAPQHQQRADVPYVVDLDHEAREDGGVMLEKNDYDVS